MSTRIAAYKGAPIEVEGAGASFEIEVPFKSDRPRAVLVYIDGGGDWDEKYASISIEDWAAVVAYVAAELKRTAP